jgi:hypothetical protein
MTTRRKILCQVGIASLVLTAIASFYYYSFSTSRYVYTKDYAAPPTFVVCGITFPSNPATLRAYFIVYYPLIEYRAASVPVKQFRGYPRYAFANNDEAVTVWPDDCKDPVTIYIPRQFKSKVKSLVTGHYSLDLTCAGEAIPDQPFYLRYKLLAFAPTPD